MDRKPLSLMEENAWTINLLIVSAIIGTVATIWLAPWIGASGGFPGVIIPMMIALAIGSKLDRARKRRRDQLVSPSAPAPDAPPDSN